MRGYVGHRTPELLDERNRALEKCQQLNALPTSDRENRDRVIGELFHKVGKNPFITPPFSCEYGSNVTAGEFAIRIPSSVHCITYCRVPFDHSQGLLKLPPLGCSYDCAAFIFLYVCERALS